METSTRASLVAHSLPIIACLRQPGSTPPHERACVQGRAVFGACMGFHCILRHEKQKFCLIRKGDVADKEEECTML